MNLIFKWYHMQCMGENHWIGWRFVAEYHIVEEMVYFVFLIYHALTYIALSLYWWLAAFVFTKVFTPVEWNVCFIEHHEMTTTNFILD